MDVQFPPDVERKLAQLSATTGREPRELVQEVVAGHLVELARVHETFDSRYDDLKSGHVEPIDRDDAHARLREMSKRRRSEWA